MTFGEAGADDVEDVERIKRCEQQTSHFLFDHIQ